MKRTVLFTLLCIFLVPIFGSTTLGGSSGYIVVPSAEVAPSEVHSSVTTAYSATITSGKVIHIPSILLSFSDTVESSFAVDIGNDIDLLLNGKWRFTKRETTSFAAGVLAQVSGVSNTNKLSPNSMWLPPSQVPSWTSLPRQRFASDTLSKSP
jgi:hypothetical protein